MVKGRVSTQITSTLEKTQDVKISLEISKSFWNWVSLKTTYTYSLVVKNYSGIIFRFVWELINMLCVDYLYLLFPRAWEKPKIVWIPTCKSNWIHKFLFEFFFLSSSNHTAYSQAQLKACYPSPDYQQTFCEHFCILYIRVQKRMFAKATVQGISREVR